MTDEGKGITEDWIEDKGAAYAYAFDSGGKFHRWAGVRGIPDSILINPEGQIIWRGHPMRLTDSEVEKAIKGALRTPVYEWGARAKGVRKALAKGDYAKALEAASDLSAEDRGPEIVAFIESTIRSRLERMETAMDAGDYLEARTLAEDARKNMKGLEPEAKAIEILEQLKKSPDIQKVLKGQELLEKLELAALDVSKRKDVDKLIDKARKLRQKYPSTIVAEHADELVRTLDKKRRDMR